MQFRVLTISPYILKFRASWRRQRGERGQTSPRIQSDDDCSLLSLISVPWSAPASAQARTCYCLSSAHTFTVMSPHRRAACHSQLLFKMCWRGLAPLQPQLVSLWQHENNPEMGSKTWASMLWCQLFEAATAGVRPLKSSGSCTKYEENFKA